MKPHVSSALQVLPTLRPPCRLSRATVTMDPLLTHTWEGSHEASCLPWFRNCCFIGDVVLLLLCYCVFSRPHRQWPNLLAIASHISIKPGRRLIEIGSIIFHRARRSSHTTYS